MFRVSLFVGKNMYAEYYAEDEIEANEMAKKMKSFHVYDGLAGHEIEVGSPKVSIVEGAEG